MVDPLPLQFGLPGGPEVLIILLIAVLLFGTNKIPKLARSTGEAMGEFQKGRQEVEEELQEMREGPSEDTVEEPATTTTTEPETETTTAETEPETETVDDDEEFEIADAEPGAEADAEPGAAETETEETN